MKALTFSSILNEITRRPPSIVVFTSLGVKALATTLRPTL